MLTNCRCVQFVVAFCPCRLSVLVAGKWRDRHFENGTREVNVRVLRSCLFLIFTKISHAIWSTLGGSYQAYEFNFLCFTFAVLVTFVGLITRQLYLLSFVLKFPVLLQLLTYLLTVHCNIFSVQWDFYICNKVQIRVSLSKLFFVFFLPLKVWSIILK